MQLPHTGQIQIPQERCLQFELENSKLLSVASYTAVFSIREWGNDTKNGCVGGYSSQSDATLFHCLKA